MGALKTSFRSHGFSHYINIALFWIVVFLKIIAKWSNVFCAYGSPGAMREKLGSSENGVRMKKNRPEIKGIKTINARK